jgi:hypothetical protein
MSRRTAAILVILATLIGGFGLSHYSANASTCTTTTVNCGDCGLTACQSPGADATSGTHEIDLNTANLACNTNLSDQLKCGISKYCATIPIPQGCPNPPVDPWRCRWVTISISGYSSCTNCWRTDLVFPCCRLPT